MLYSTGHLMNDLRKFSSQIVNKNVKNLKTGPSVVVVLTTIWLTYTHKNINSSQWPLIPKRPQLYSVTTSSTIPVYFFVFCLPWKRKAGKWHYQTTKNRCLIWPLWTWTVATSSSLNCYNELLFSAHLGFFVGGRPQTLVLICQAFLAILLTQREIRLSPAMKMCTKK